MSWQTTEEGHAEPELLVGNRYRLVRRLGAGGYGRVWLAHDTMLGVDVAVKEVVLPRSLKPEEEAARLARAEREARNAARLRGHPQVVAVYDVVIEDGVPWTVMQLVDGRSLDDHLRAYGPLGVEQVAVIADALLKALDAAHRAGIMHRDVKPANVMLAADGGVLLTDFGIAERSGDPGLTAAGAIVGSVEYLAPERVRGEDARPASDLFSLGVTLYQALEGVSPFRRPETAASYGAVLYDAPPPMTRGGRLTGVVEGLLVKEAERRLTVEAATRLLGGAPGPVPARAEPVAPTQASNTPPQPPVGQPDKPQPPVGQPNMPPQSFVPPTQSAGGPPQMPHGQAGIATQPQQPFAAPHAWPQYPYPRQPKPPFDPTRVIIPALLTLFFAVVAFLPFMDVPDTRSDIGGPYTVRMYQLFDWELGSPITYNIASTIELAAIVLGLAMIAALTSRSNTAVRVVGYLALSATVGLEVWTDHHYGGPWTYDLPIGIGLWLQWVGFALLVTGYVFRDIRTRRQRKATAR